MDIEKKYGLMTLVEMIKVRFQYSQYSQNEKHAYTARLLAKSFADELTRRIVTHSY